ncbi:GNAT family N-acetyltransferase [Fredinandcohnia sp. SECRCQ15]|uniref:GNAT family N-acetyltransferase n=2 Tax=Fredinandcohnia quinoae TaxID=2918902 RepID=A0AAW5EA23_9BACI|nr:GNAT family protein [Fredinandcohnia sp. SECRCQ15]MCH1626737.1 GNAT family N-acetyltransferase [Fredinandcohnia sp. SECRCQ15]
MSEQRYFPKLETNRLILRNVNDADTEFIFKLFSNEKICDFLYDEELFTKIEDAIEFIEWNTNPEEKGYNRWIIEKKDTNEKIGTCGFDLWDRTNNIAEIGYDLWYEFWGCGYMKEALIAAIENGFNKMNLNRINAFVALENKKSTTTLESLGFINEGIYRDKHLLRGKYYDHYSYSLLKKDWNKQKIFNNMGAVIE